MSEPTAPHPAATPSTPADLIVAAVLACPGVAAMYGGGLRQVATYMPGRRVVGVRLNEHRIEVAVAAVFGVSVATVAEQVRAAVAPLAAGLAVDVHVGDVQTPEEARSDRPPALPAGRSGTR